MDSVSIQLCDAESIETAVTLLHAQLEEHEIVTAEKDLREVVSAVVSDPRLGFILLASANNGTPFAVAYAAAHLSAEHGGVIGWLEELYVSPAWRGRGVGSALLSEIRSRGRALGWRGLELEVVAGHKRAVPLYRRHGFELLARTRFSQIFRR